MHSHIPLFNLVQSQALIKALIRLRFNFLNVKRICSVINPDTSKTSCGCHCLSWNVSLANKRKLVLHIINTHGVSLAFLFRFKAGNLCILMSSPFIFKRDTKKSTSSPHRLTADCRGHFTHLFETNCTEKNAAKETVAGRPRVALEMEINELW